MTWFDLCLWKRRGRFLAFIHSICCHNACFRLSCNETETREDIFFCIMMYIQVKWINGRNGCGLGSIHWLLMGWNHIWKQVCSQLDRCLSRSNWWRNLVYTTKEKSPENQVKVIVHLKMRIPLWFTHPQAFLGIYDFLLSDEYKWSYIKENVPWSFDTEEVFACVIHT